MPKTSHFFVRQTKETKEGKKENHKIGIIAMSYDDNLLEISGAFCSPFDNFSVKKAIVMAYGRLNSLKEHSFATNIDTVLNMSFSELLEKLDFNSNLLASKKPKYYDDIISKYTKLGGNVDLNQHTVVLKRAVHDLVGISDTL